MGPLRLQENEELHGLREPDVFDLRQDDGYEVYDEESTDDDEGD